MANMTVPAAACRGGLLGWLWSLIGSTTPTYTGAGQPAAGRGWCGWFSTTPTYQVAPAEPPSPQPQGDATQTEQELDAGSGARPGSIAIVIQRE